MYQPMLFLHWKQVRLALAPFVVAAFGLPLFAVRQMGVHAGEDPELRTYLVLAFADGLGPLFPSLAVAIGVTLALSAWNWDHQLGHVYALSLPLARWRFAMLKMGAGAVLSLIPAAAFLIGTLVAVASVTLPAGIHAYPGALALRFFLTMLVSYAVFFALASSTIKTVAIVVSSVLVFLLLGSSLGALLAQAFPALQDVNVVMETIAVLAGKHGPFEVFAGSWALFDV